MSTWHQCTGEPPREKPAEQLEKKARCPDCGHACVEEGGSWWCGANAFACYNTGPMQGHEVWRRWGDRDKADGIYWVKWSDDRRVWAVNAAYHNLDDTHWVIGPLPEPHAPGVG